MKNQRAKFPALNQKNKVIYFDNACQTLVPERVFLAMQDYYKNYPACAGRSNHKWAEKTSQKIWQTREKIAKFINAKHPEEIIFTKNTTEGINLIANCLKPKSVLGTDKEHNSNRLVWGRAWSTNAKNPDLISYALTSNLDGSSLKVTKSNALILIDVAQAIGHQKLDVQKLNIDFMAFSGHKIFGPTGTGILYGKKNLLKKIPPFLWGGGMISQILPEKFEAGLQNYAGIIGLNAAVNYLETIIKNIPEHDFKLNNYLTQELKKLPVKILGPKNPKLRSSIISFYSDKISSQEIALKLNQKNIFVRAGKFCCDYWFEKNKIPDAVRVSIYIYNTLEECDIFIKNLKQILNAN